MTTPEIISTVLGALGLVGGAIGFFRSRSASKAARASADVAGRASDRSIAAAEAAADAQLRIAAAIEASRDGTTHTPAEAHEVRWRVDQIGDYQVRATNVGDLTAGAVDIAADPPEAAHLLRVFEQPDLRPGEGLTFSVMRTMGGPQVSAVEVHWTDPDGTARTQGLRIV